MILRPAEARDCPAIAEIWNPIIRDTVVTFNPVQKTALDIEAMLAEKQAMDQPFVLAETDHLLGFATYGAFRNGYGYRFTAEHTIILAPEARGQGAGRALMAAIEDHAAARGIGSMFAGVSSGNPGAVQFHQHMGYDICTVLPEVGFKFDRWFDLTLLRKRLSVPDNPDRLR